MKIDAVEAMANMLQPRSDELLSSPLKPLFELESGRAVLSFRISEALKLGAIDLGLDSRRYATHSLRRGGATAVSTAGTPTEFIRRWGRWPPDCSHRCVFGAAEEIENLSRTMVQADYTLAMALKDFRASVSRGHSPVRGPSQTTDISMC